MIMKFDRNQNPTIDYVSEYIEKFDFCFLKFEFKNI